ncbi:FecR domain-containing protein [Mucilaginibacter gynuensis]|uniref:FecR domain-containing protein n=1 Tax=Mucilaginibacter gynuensis TaxID=1302236 RepID=A0ABP8FQI4_9SPHI
MNLNAENMEMNDDLLISCLLGEASAEQVAQVTEWRKDDAANERHYMQFAQVWEASDKLKFTGQADAQESLGRLKQKIAIQKADKGKEVILPRSYNWLRIAAVLLAFAGGVWLYMINKNPAKDVDFATDKAVRIDTLSDGSVITLNKNSLLQYPETFSGNKRKVTLVRGEAFFSITPDKSKPFIINSSGTVIKVVGTSFNVKNRNSNIEVIVETGIVEVSNSGKMLSLKPGEKAVVKKLEKELVKQKNTDQLYNYYRSKEFVADDTPLWRIVEVLNEAYDSRIIIGRKELRNLPLNTTFKNEPLDSVLKVITRTFNITVEKKNNQIILK